MGGREGGGVSGIDDRLDDIVLGAIELVGRREDEEEIVDDKEKVDDVDARLLTIVEKSAARDLVLGIHRVEVERTAGALGEGCDVPRAVLFLLSEGGSIGMVEEASTSESLVIAPRPPSLCVPLAMIRRVRAWVFSVSDSDVFGELARGLERAEAMRGEPVRGEPAAPHGAPPPRCTR